MTIVASEAGKRNASNLSARITPQPKKKRADEPTEELAGRSRKTSRDEQPTDECFLPPNT
jgi:hypothetical protein